MHCLELAVHPLTLRTWDSWGSCRSLLDTVLCANCNCVLVWGECDVLLRCGTVPVSLIVIIYGRMQLLDLCRHMVDEVILVRLP